MTSYDGFDEFVGRLPFELQVEVAENRDRKDYTESEKAELQKKIMAHLALLSQHGRRSDLDTTSAKSLEEVDHGTVGKVAKMFGESHETTRKRIYVYNKAQTGEKYAELLHRLDQGIDSLSGTFSKVRRLEFQEKAIQQAKQQILPGGRAILECKSFEFSNLQPESVDQIVSDMPYGAEHLPLYRKLAPWAYKVMKPGGSCMLYPGHLILPEIMNALKEAGLTYWWTLALWQKGTRRTVYGRKVMVAWKPIVWYVKGSEPKCQHFVPDRIDDTGQPTKERHEWEQHIADAKHLIRYGSYEHELIVDPCMGSGTTIEAALELNRKACGYEIQTEHFAVANQRISSWLKAHEKQG